MAMFAFLLNFILVFRGLKLPNLLQSLKLPHPTPRPSSTSFPGPVENRSGTSRERGKRRNVSWRDSRRRRRKGKRRPRRQRKARGRRRGRARERKRCRKKRNSPRLRRQQV